MKTFALSLLTAYAMGSTIINVDHLQGLNDLRLDLTYGGVDAINDDGYTLTSGNVMEIILNESPSVGSFKYDENEIEPLFKVTSEWEPPM